MSFEGDFQTIYTKFKLHFYRETINEFANFIKISQPNAAYKVNNLIRKGFLRKIRSQKDKREYFLEATDKYIEYLDIENSYLHKVLERLEGKFTKAQLEELDGMLKIISTELMPEIPDFQERKRDA